MKYTYSDVVAAAATLASYPESEATEIIGKAVSEASTQLTSAAQQINAISAFVTLAPHLLLKGQQEFVAEGAELAIKAARDLGVAARNIRKMLGD